MRYLLIISLACFCQLSCNEKNNAAKAREHYSTVHKSTHATKLIGQRFVDSLAVALQQLHSDNNKVFDLKNLRLSLDSLKQSATQTLSTLKNIGVFDKEDDPDNVEVKYENIVIGLCDNEFEKMLEILGSKDNDKGSNIYHLKPAFEKLQDAGKECENVSVRVSEKYHIAFTDSLNN